MTTGTRTDFPPRAAKILVAEDDEDLRLTLCDWLALSGYAVTEARDGLEALELASREAFDVVLTDLRMPRCDGLTLLNALRARDPDIAVVFLSGQATLTEVIEALRQGRSFDFLQKPIPDLRRVSEVVARALQQRAIEGSPATTPLGWQGLPQDVIPAVEADPILTKAFRFIEAHFQGAIGLAEVAAATGYTASYLTRRAKQVTGKTLQQWIIAYKMAEAQRLLAETAMSSENIASALGYSDLRGFHRQFRKTFAMTPQSWRQQAHQE